MMVSFILDIILCIYIYNTLKVDEVDRVFFYEILDVKDPSLCDFLFVYVLPSTVATYVLKERKQTYFLFIILELNSVNLS